MNSLGQPSALIFFAWLAVPAALAVTWLAFYLRRVLKFCDCPRLRLQRQDGIRFTQFHHGTCPNFHN